MGTRQGRERQEEIWYRSEVAEAPGHPFYRKLEAKLKEAGFDRFCEQECKRYYADGVGRPSLVPGVYFRLMLIGFFEGIDSERGIAWRVADSLSLRQFLGYGIDENTPDHVTISRTRRLLEATTHKLIFDWVLEQLAQAGLVKGKTMGVDSTTLEANAAMKSIVRRDSGDNYMDYLKKVAEAEGIEAPDAAALLRLDRKRKKKTSNEDWKSPADPEAEITKLKDGRTALAYKVEQAVDMETGAIVAVTTHPGAAADSATVTETLCEAGEAVAELIDVKNAEGQYPVAGDGIAEVVADKGYHSNQTMIEIQELGLRTYVAEPDRGPRNWEGKEEERDAVYANRRRINGERGKRLQSQRGEKIERNFAHQFDTGGMDRLYLRGRENIHKRLLIQAAACNLALLLRSLYGAGKPKAAHDLKGAAIFVFLRLISVLLEAECVERDFRASLHLAFNDHQVSRSSFCRSSKTAV
ncbi:MAG: Transposase domain protein [Edaphobacter sp.]|nr:Transposase domain protein [Edaphobacter sp.]